MNDGKKQGTEYRLYLVYNGQFQINQVKHVEPSVKVPVRAAPLIIRYIMQAYGIRLMTMQLEKSLDMHDLESKVLKTAEWRNAYTSSKRVSKRNK